MKQRDDIPGLVLAVVARIYELTGGRPQPWYVERSAIGIAAPVDGIAGAIYFGEVSGWLVGATEPPGGVAITPAGIQLLQERGLI
jgi:hypothetical protein